MIKIMIDLLKLNALILKRIQESASYKCVDFSKQKCVYKKYEKTMLSMVDF